MGRPKATAAKKATDAAPPAADAPADASTAPAAKGRKAAPKPAVAKRGSATPKAAAKPRAAKPAAAAAPADAAAPAAKGRGRPPSKAKDAAKKEAKPAPKRAAKAKAKVSDDAPPPPIGPKPTSTPLFTPASKDLYGYWYGKWYEIEVLKDTDRWAKGQHVYLIRWTKDPNLAKPGEWATNESYYPEDWIFPKEDIPPHQLPGAAPATKKRAAPAKDKKATRPQAVPAPAFGGATGAGFGVFKAGLQTAKHKYVYKWQYFDDKRSSKNNAGWHDYDISGSDVVEEAYQSWVSNPFIDVRAVYSGHWNYMVDFNQMQQTNVDHADHTVRALRRVRVDDESDAMDEQRKIRRQVSLQRISSQIDQVASADGAAAAPSSTAAPALERIPSHRGSQSGTAVDPAAAPVDQPAVAVGSLVRVPSGRAGIVLTTSGAPSLPVQVQFSDGETQFLDPKEVQKE